MSGTSVSRACQSSQEWTQESSVALVVLESHDLTAINPDTAPAADPRTAPPKSGLLSRCVQLGLVMGAWMRGDLQGCATYTQPYQGLDLIHYSWNPQSHGPNVEGSLESKHRCSRWPCHAQRTESHNTDQNFSVTSISSELGREPCCLSGCRPHRCKAGSFHGQVPYPIREPVYEDEASKKTDKIRCGRV